jgi:membrane-associated phospholipid phosphatase
MIYSERKKLIILTGIIALFNIVNPCRILAFQSSIQDIDTVNTKQPFYSVSDQNKATNQKLSDNFYKTDSIFSFQSQKGYIPSLYSNFSEQMLAPVKFKTKQWLITGAAIGITALLLHFDNDIDKWATVQKQKHEWVNKSSPQITLFGSVYGWSTVATIGLASAVFKKEKGVQTSLLATQALITSGAWVQLIKHFTGREDPSASYIYSKKPGGKWWGPFAQYDQDLPVYKSVTSFDAFPSGHTAAAFSIATVFATQYSDIKAVPIISYSMATLVGISRLTEHAHWSSDVFVGALFGYVCGKEVVAHYNKTYCNQGKSDKSNSKVKKELTLIQEGNRAGFLLKW